MKRSVSAIWQYSLALTLLTFTFFFGSCSKDEDCIGPDCSPSSVIFPTSNIRYAQHVQPLFNQTCALSSCHGPQESADRVKLDSYENAIFGVRGIRVIVPGSPENSELVLRIEGRAAQRMPLSRNPLNQNQINRIRAWIAEGAQRN